MVKQKHNVAIRTLPLILGRSFMPRFKKKKKKKTIEEACRGRLYKLAPQTTNHLPIICQQKAGRVRGPSKAKPAAAEVEEDEDEEEEEEMKPKPVAARYIRGPPLTKPQSHQGSSETTQCLVFYQLLSALRSICSIRCSYSLMKVKHSASCKMICKVAHTSNY